MKMLLLGKLWQRIKESTRNEFWFWQSILSHVGRELSWVRDDWGTSSVETWPKLTVGDDDKLTGWTELVHAVPLLPFVGFIFVLWCICTSVSMTVSKHNCQVENEFIPNDKLQNWYITFAYWYLVNVRKKATGLFIPRIQSHNFLKDGQHISA